MSEPNMPLSKPPLPRAACPAAAIAEAEKCKETGEEKVILFNLSGHGLIDMAAYTQYLAGNLFDYEVSDEEVTRNVKELEQII